MTAERRWLVIGPDREWKEVLTDDGQGPIEHFRDVYVVDARTRKEARWSAFRRARENGDAWAKNLDYYGQHPMTGVIVEPADGYPVEDEDPRFLVLDARSLLATVTPSD